MNLLTLDSLTSRFNVNFKMSEQKKKTVITSSVKDNW